MRNKKLFLVSVIIALFTSLFIYLWLKKEQTKAQGQIPKVKILVAARPIPAREIVEKGMIRYEEIPYSPITDKISQKEEEVVGKVATSAIILGEALYKDKFIEKGAGAGLSFIVPLGKRAVTISVNNTTGVAGLLKPGDFVDVISTFDVPRTQVEGEQRPPLSMSITLLQNVQILALDTTTEVSVSPPTTAPPSTPPPPPPPSYTMVTLAISPKDAERLTLLAEKSINRLALRSVKDSAVYFTSGITLDALAGIKEIDKASRTIRKIEKQAKIAAGGTLYDIKELPLPTLLSPLSEASFKIDERKQVDIIRGVQVEKVGIK